MNISVDRPRSQASLSVISGGGGGGASNGDGGAGLGQANLLLPPGSQDSAAEAPQQGSYKQVANRFINVIKKLNS